MSSNDDKICAVCLEKPKDSQIQSCGHEYCRKCLLDLIKYRKNYNFLLCPLCRQKMTSNERIGVFIPSKEDLLRMKYRESERLRKINSKKIFKELVLTFIFYILIFLIMYLTKNHIGPYICINYPDLKICNKFNKYKYYKYYKYYKNNL